MRTHARMHAARHERSHICMQPGMNARTYACNMHQRAHAHAFAWATRTQRAHTRFMAAVAAVLAPAGVETEGNAIRCR